jgi:hypothetical protein
VGELLRTQRGVQCIIVVAATGELQGVSGLALRSLRIVGAEVQELPDLGVQACASCEIVRPQALERAFRQR